MAPGQSTQPPNAYVPPLDYRRRAERRLEVDSEPLLKLQLQEWDDQMRLELARIESYRGRCNAAKSELYQLIGFFTLFQGVVFTAVATASKLTCQTSLCPILLSLFTSIGTAISAHSKLDSYAIEKFKMISAEKNNHGIKNKIDLLKQQGKAFDFGLLNKANADDAVTRGEVGVGKEKGSQAVLLGCHDFPCYLLPHLLGLLCRCTVLGSTTT